MLKNIRSSLRSNVITGILVLAPFGAVFWIVLWIWNLLMSVSYFIPQSFHPTLLFNISNPIAIKAVDFLLTLLVLAVIILLVWSIGLVSRNYIGKRALESLSSFLTRVPVLSTVYSTLEQLLRTFATGQTKNFRRVVYIEYPRKGVFTLALVTGERELDLGTGQKSKYLTVYVPTTPNPTSGFYLTVAESEIKNVDMSVEDALKEIISMGMVHTERKSLGENPHG